MNQAAVVPIVEHLIFKSNQLTSSHAIVTNADFLKFTEEGAFITFF